MEAAGLFASEPWIISNNGSLILRLPFARTPLMEKLFLPIVADTFMAIR